VVPDRKEPAMNLIFTRPALPSPWLPNASAPSVYRPAAVLLTRSLGVQEAAGVPGGHYSCGDYLKYLTE
jgi:hypothetical protein